MERVTSEAEVAAAYAKAVKEALDSANCYSLLYENDSDSGKYDY